MLIRNVFLLTIMGFSPIASYAATYYVSPTGNDLFPGTLSALPWKTIAKVNSAHLGSGDQVLFQRGGVWREMLVPSASGLYFGAYGTGGAPSDLRKCKCGDRNMDDG